MRRPNHRARRQGRRLRVLQELPSRGDRADPHARLGARRDARMAPAIRQATLVNRLVSDSRTQARRRGTQAIPSPRLAGAVDRHRHLRVLACSSHRRVPRRLTDSVCRGHRPRCPVPSKRGARPASAARPHSRPPGGGGRRLARAVGRQPHLPARAPRQRVHRPSRPARANRQRARRDRRARRPRCRPRGVGPRLAAVRRLGRPGAQAVGHRHRHRHDPRAAAPVHQPAGLERPRAIRRR